MNAELEVLRTVADLGLLVDAREWDALTALFADEVAVDYTSLNGGDPVTDRSGRRVAGASRAARRDPPSHRQPVRHRGRG